MKMAILVALFASIVIIHAKFMMDALDKSSGMVCEPPITRCFYDLVIWLATINEL